MLPATPRGFKDVLPREARWREHITNKVKQAFSLWGYAPIETPTLEVLEVLEQGGVLREKPLRLLDTDNKLLVLRPDVTLPVARMVASRLDTAELPLRFRYVQPVFREEESLKAAAREYTQIGIELIGASGPAADAEVVIMLIEALEVAGLKDFTVALCTVGVLRSLLTTVLDKGVVDEQWCEKMLAAYHSSNLVEIVQLASDARIEERFSTVFRRLGAISGGAAAIDEVRLLLDALGPLEGFGGSGGSRCLESLNDLATTWQIIEGLGYGNQVRIDFSVMSAFDYYTGIVMEAYAPGVGTSLGSGGRYDRMLETYGTRAPAAGFALCLEAVMHALIAQGCTDAVFEIERVQCTKIDLGGQKGTVPAMVSAFCEAAALRADGIPVVLNANPAPERKEKGQ